MNILLIHQNFPGQFPHLARHLQARREVHLVAIARKGAPGLPGIRTFYYDLQRPVSPRAHPYVRPMEQAVLHGQAVARVLQTLRQQNFVPDVVVAHPGWGEALYVKDVFPRVRVIGFFEFFYHGQGADAGFDPLYPVTLDQQARIRSRNALHLMNLEYSDAGVSPTHWQRSLHPTAYQTKIRVIHEGVDTALFKPDKQARFRLPDGRILATGDEVVTYVARNLEPYRGFPTMMRALERLCDMRPNCVVVLLGGDQVSYGAKPQDASSWREKMLAEVNIDQSRVHFLGKIPYNSYRGLLQVSAAHVYLTYPFVLSWSMLEAMASGCLVIGSATAPVQEVIRDEYNGLLVDFFDPEEVANKVHLVLENRADFQKIRETARATVLEHYSIEQGISAYCSLIDEIAH
jgi:glycosyltransferase involved in cell wall biosynthesis